MYDDALKKKNFLVAWYGITDLKAAMGMKKQGPILRALLSGSFSEALILAYTKKDLQGVDVEEQKEYMELLQADRNSNETLSSDEIWELQDKFANTPIGHDFFFTWLQEELFANQLELPIIRKECYLEKLNDSHGIYTAALDAISYIRKQHGDNVKITLFISPGTPVMAFSWALVALVNSDMQIDILVSPDMRKSAEIVDLPYKLTDSSLKNTNLSHPEKFDVIFHLYGEQPMPAVLGILQFDCVNHVFVTSKGYSTRRLQHLLDYKKEYLLEIDPFSPQNTKDVILNFVKLHPEWQLIGFNLTGGTKLMYAGAMAACNQCFGVPFYFETRNHKMLWLSDYISEEIVGLKHIEGYFSLSHMAVTRSGYWNDNPDREVRKELTLKLWKWKSEISRIYKKIVPYNATPGKPFHVYQKDISAYLDENSKATLTLGDYSFTIPYCPDFAKYISGGWLEEYVFLQLESLIDKGEITDIRIGLEISWEEEKQTTVQEFDVVFTDGKRLYFLECKAGAYKSEDVQKLQNNVRNYGGIDALGVMTVCFLPNGKSKNALLKRIKAAPNLAMFVGEAIPERLTSRIINFKGGTVYTPCLSKKK